MARSVRHPFCVSFFHPSFRVGEASVGTAFAASLPKGSFTLRGRSAMALDDFIEPEVAGAVGVAGSRVSAQVGQGVPGGGGGGPAVGVVVWGRAVRVGA